MEELQRCMEHRNWKPVPFVTPPDDFIRVGSDLHQSRVERCKDSQRNRARTELHILNLLRTSMHASGKDVVEDETGETWTREELDAAEKRILQTQESLVEVEEDEDAVDDEEETGAAGQGLGPSGETAPWTEEEWEEVQRATDPAAYEPVIPADMYIKSRDELLEDASKTWKNRTTVRDALMHSIVHNGLYSARLRSANWMQKMIPRVYDTVRRTDRKWNGQQVTVELNNVCVMPPCIVNAEGHLTRSWPELCCARGQAYEQPVIAEIQTTFRRNKDGAVIRVLREKQVQVGVILAFTAADECGGLTFPRGTEFERTNLGGVYISPTGGLKLGQSEMRKGINDWFIRDDLVAMIYARQPRHWRSTSTMYIWRMQGEGHQPFYMSIPFCKEAQYPLSCILRCMGFNTMEEAVVGIVTGGANAGVLPVTEEWKASSHFWDEKLAEYVESALKAEVGHSGYKSKRAGTRSIPNVWDKSLEWVMEYCVQMENQTRAGNGTQDHIESWNRELRKEICPHIGVFGHRSTLRAKRVELCAILRLLFIATMEQAHIKAGGKPVSFSKVKGVKGPMRFDDPRSYETRRVMEVGSWWLMVYNRVVGMIRDRVRGLQAHIPKMVRSSEVTVAEWFEQTFVPEMRKTVHKVLQSGDASEGQAKGGYTDKNCTRSLGTGSGIYNATRDLQEDHSEVPRTTTSMENRALHETSIGYHCVNATTEGATCGLVMVKTILSTTWTGVPEADLARFIRVGLPKLWRRILPIAGIQWTENLKPAADADGGWSLNREKDVARTLMKHGNAETVLVRINGIPYGYLLRGAAEAKVALRVARRRGLLPEQVMIRHRKDRRELLIAALPGTISAPFLVLEQHGVYGTLDRVRSILRRWREGYVDSVFETMKSEGLIEYLCPKEVGEGDIIIRANPMEVMQVSELEPYTHCNLHPMILYSIITLTTPSLSSIMGTRATFNSQLMQGMLTRYKEMLGRPGLHTEWSSAPVVNTMAASILNSGGESGFGVPLNKAMCTYNGTGIEDAYVVSRTAIELGPWAALRQYGITTDVTPHAPPPKISYTHGHPGEGVRNTAMDGYDHLDSDGVPYVGAELTSAQVYVGKQMRKGTKKEAVERAVDVYCRRYFKTMRVESVVWSSNAKAITITIRTSRALRVGEGSKIKNCHGQKGIIGLVVNREDMPYSQHDGTIPDVLHNPHSATRTTNAMGNESRVSHYAAQKGTQVGLDGYFQHPKARQKPVALNPEDVKEEDVKYMDYMGAFTRKMQEDGNPYAEGAVHMFNPLTGELSEEKTSVGTEQFTIQKQMAPVLVHAVDNPPLDMTTHEVVAGKKVGGGMNYGYMEMAAITGLGMSNTIDDWTIKEMKTVCADCGCLTRGNRNDSLVRVTQSKEGYAYCTYCRASTGIVNVELPHRHVVNMRHIEQMLTQMRFKVTRNPADADMDNSAAPGAQHPPVRIGEKRSALYAGLNQDDPYVQRAMEHVGLKPRVESKQMGKLKQMRDDAEMMLEGMKAADAVDSWVQVPSWEDLQNLTMEATAFEAPTVAQASGEWGAGIGDQVRMATTSLI